MTPQEKAKELFDKYVELSSIFVGDYESEKEMCLIAIDEVLNELFEIALVTGSSYVHKHIDYYQEVKQEINKL